MVECIHGLNLYSYSEIYKILFDIRHYENNRGVTSTVGRHGPKQVLLHVTAKDI